MFVRVCVVEKLHEIAHSEKSPRGSSVILTVTNVNWSYSPFKGWFDPYPGTHVHFKIKGILLWFILVFCYCYNWCCNRETVVRKGELPWTLAKAMSWTCAWWGLAYKVMKGRAQVGLVWITKPTEHLSLKVGAVLMPVRAAGNAKRLLCWIS